VYGLDSFLLSPPLSLIASVLLFISVDAIGIYVLRIIKIDLLNYNWVRWQTPIIGAAVLSIILYPIALSGYSSLLVFRVIAFVLLVISLFHTIELFKNIFPIKKLELSFVNAILIVLLVGYWILALLPITDADSLDYHVGVPIYLLNSGAMPVIPEWFHSRLAGSGEVLVALGLSVGAEQFGSLLQYSGLLAITGVLLHSANIAGIKEHNNDWSVLIAIAVLSSPVLVPLVSSVKPQLLPVAMTTTALALLIFSLISTKTFTSNHYIKSYLLICILVMSASQMKFTYLLGGGVIGLTALWWMKTKKLTSSAILVGGFSFILIMLPAIIWKQYYFGGAYIDALFMPFTGDYFGMDNFEKMLRTYRDSPIWFPFSLVFPSQAGIVTTVIGVGVFMVALIRPNKDKILWLLIVLSAIVFIFSVLFGPSTSRSYLEPFIWLMFALSIQGKSLFFEKYKNWLKIPIFLQSSIVIFIFIYSVVLFLPGITSVHAREQVMSKYANGYEVMQWVDDILPKDAVLLSSHRSIALSPRYTVSLDWLSFIEHNKENIEVGFYLNKVKQKGVTHILFQGDDYKNTELFGLLAGCLGKIYGPGYAHIATRNPLNQGQPYSLWIAEIEVHS